jgi:Holliday junction resolvase RusA-like endonuclease
MKVNIKPLSVNQAWKGKRYKTEKYKNYETTLMYVLPKDVFIPSGEINLTLIFGQSSPLADFDNPVKLFVDCLQKKYGFNDRKIKRCVIEVKKVKKGEEFIDFEMVPYPVFHEPSGC